MTEDQLEQEALLWLADVGYQFIHGPDIAPDGISPERIDYWQVVLTERLRSAIDRLNPGIPLVARQDALQQVLDLGIPALLSANRHFTTITQQEIDRAMERLNNRPRKRLGYQTPTQLFFKSGIALQT